MSLDFELRSMPAELDEARVIAAFVAYCGVAIASRFEHRGARGVHLLGETATGKPWRRGPRYIEVAHVGPTILLSLREMDNFTIAVARGFAVWFAREQGGHAVSSQTGEVLT